MLGQIIVYFLIFQKVIEKFFPKIPRKFFYVFFNNLERVFQNISNRNYFEKYFEGLELFFKNFEMFQGIFRNYTKLPVTLKDSKGFEISWGYFLNMSQ